MKNLGYEISLLGSLKIPLALILSCIQASQGCVDPTGKMLTFTSSFAKMRRISSHLVKNGHINKGKWLGKYSHPMEHLGFAMKPVRPYGKHPTNFFLTQTTSLLRTNISNPKALLEMSSFPRWDTLYSSLEDNVFFFSHKEVRVPCNKDPLKLQYWGVHGS